MMLTSFIRGVSGEVEIGRVLLASSGLAGVVSPLVFQYLDMMHNGWKFDVTAWCLAYPGGLAALSGIGVYTLGKKDKAVAEAKQTQATTDTAMNIAKGGSV